MGGVIAFGESPEAIWLVAGWAYRRFLADVLATSPDDEKFVYALQQAAALQGLNLDIQAQEDTELTKKLYKAIRNVAVATIEESPGQRLSWREGLDPAGQTMYVDAVRELLVMIEKAGGDFG